MSEKPLSLPRQIMDAREAQVMIQRASIALGVNGWTAAEIERVLAGLHAVVNTLEWFERNETKIKEKAEK